MDASGSSRNQGVPEKLKCFVGDHWAVPGDFSNKSIADYLARSRRGEATPTNTKIACRMHKGEPALELLCQGPCQRMRPLAFFSKNSRRIGENKCKDCVDWQQCNELGQTFETPEVTLKTGSKQDDRPIRKSTVMPNRDAIEKATTTEEDGATMRARKAGPIAEDLAQAMDNTTFFDLMTGMHAGISNERPPLSPSQVTGDRLAGQLTDVVGDFDSEIGAPTVTSGLDSTLAEQENHPVAWNAWGPDGTMVKHTPHAIGTGSSDDASQSTDIKGKSKVQGKGKNLEGKKGGWSKPSQRKFEPTIPAYLMAGHRADHSSYEAKDDDGYLSDDCC